jgi:hypothetical protein
MTLSCLGILAPGGRIDPASDPAVLPILERRGKNMEPPPLIPLIPFDDRLIIELECGNIGATKLFSSSKGIGPGLGKAVSGRLRRWRMMRE